jgi:hypothetical protein
MIPNPRESLQSAPAMRCLSTDRITLSRHVKLKLRLEAFANDWWQRFVELTFGPFMAGLVVLLILVPTENSKWADA